MRDIIYTEGFPDGWFMSHRNDDTLLCRRGEGPFSFTTCICVAPKLVQGEKWLETAKIIAKGFDNISEQYIKYKLSSYCDGCGYGPSVDEYGENSRALKTWKCQDCDHVNIRGD